VTYKSSQTFVSTLLAALLFIFPQTATAIPQKGEPAPPFMVTSTTGQKISLDNYRGKVLFLEFFATWCAPCKDSVLHLTSLSSKYGKQGVQVLGLSLDNDKDMALREFIIANRISYPVATAEEGIQVDYSVRSVPTLYVITRQGLIADKFFGYNEDIESRIDQLLIKLLSK
jgi:peroxiredoxin